MSRVGMAVMCCDVQSGRLAWGSRLHQNLVVDSNSRFDRRRGNVVEF